MTEERWSLPATWSWASMGEVADVVGGGTPPTGNESNFAKRGIAWLTPADLTGYEEAYIERGRRDLSEKGYGASAARLMPAGTVLFSSRAPVGYCAIASGEISTNQGFKSFVLKGELSPEYVRYYLLGSVEYAESKASGTTFKELSGSRAAELSIPIAPLPEQRRIVAKIDSLSSKSRRARDHLDHIPRLVEKYKQAVLAAAFRGDLTREWRLENADRLGGSSCQSSFALDDSERGAWPSEQLPDEWEWRRFGSTFVDLTDSTRKLPQKEYLSEGKFPVIDQGADTIGGYTDRADLVHLSTPPFIIFGDHTRCVKFIEQPFVQGADGVKVLHTANNVLPSYGRLALVAVDLPDKGYSRHMKFVRATLFPIAPLPEQSEIVRRVRSLFIWIDRLAAEATSARRLVDRLDQAVLAKAFRGELVRQDPEDEPASVLLERIRAERATAPKPRRGRRASVA